MPGLLVRILRPANIVLLAKNAKPRLYQGCVRASINSLNKLVDGLLLALAQFDIKRPIFISGSVSSHAEILYTKSGFRPVNTKKDFIRILCGL